MEEKSLEELRKNSERSEREADIFRLKLEKPEKMVREVSVGL